MIKKKHLQVIGIILFLGFLLFLTFNRHKPNNSNYFNYHSEIWADKAGYYVYLPAAFNFNFNPNNFPDSIDTKTGDGFNLDYQDKKVRTKYTYGVALMESPFYFVANILAKPLNFEANGFSPIYYWMINISSVFYLMFGLIYLFRFLKVRFKNNLSILVVISIFLATNLYYYAIDETGMSHIYSFSLFCYFLYFLQKTKYLLEQNFRNNLIFGFLVGIILLLRPTNAIFLTSYFFLDIYSKTEITTRIKRLIKYEKLLPIVFVVFLIVLPQLIYWKYANGSYLNYSYGEEGFNWFSPKFFKSWFSPNNGLFLYTPFYFLILVALIYMRIKKVQNGTFLLILFFLISYVFSSWWDWSFGCSFGARSYVEYLAIFSIPIAQFYSYINKKNKNTIISFYFMILVLVVFNLKMTYSYDGCFYGNRNWDWKAYIELVKSPTK